MNFRLRAFLVHLGSSATVLSLILGVLYFGWYQWPGWYVTGVTSVMAILIGVDVTLGPLVTLLIANPGKPRRELARDIGVVVTVQLIALVYGTTALWSGRPLYYVFWVNGMKVLSASEIHSKEAAVARQKNPQLAPYWYSTPRWVWAPLPVKLDGRPGSAGGESLSEAQLRVLSNIVPQPGQFKPLSQAGDELRARLRKVDQISIFSPEERTLLKQRLAQHGLPADTPNTMFLAGYGRPLLAVFDPATLRVEALIPAT